MADYTHTYTTDTTPAEVLALAEACPVGLRSFSVPLGHEPTQDSAEFRLRGGLLAVLFGGHPTVKLTAEKRASQTQLTITTNSKQLLDAMDAWASSELKATAVS